MYGKVLYNLLSNDATVSGLLSNRIFPVIVPQEALFPAIVYTQVACTFKYTHRTSQQASKIETHLIQLDIFDKSYDVMIQAAEAAKNALEGYKGTLEGQEVRNILLDREREDFDQELQLFRKIIDITLTILK